MPQNLLPPIVLLEGTTPPYYEEIGEVEGVIKYFIEGIEFEKGESLYENYLTNENLNKLVNMLLSMINIRLIMQLLCDGLEKMSPNLLNMEAKINPS